MNIRYFILVICLLLMTPFAIAFDDGNSAIPYHPFSVPADTLYLHQHKGKYVELLLTDDWESALTTQERRTIIDRADIVYQYYKEILKAEPALPLSRDSIGLLRIAVIPESYLPSGSAAWTNIGLREMEIKSNTANLQELKAELTRGLETNRHFIIHEMAHAFDLWANYLEYEPTCTPVTTTNWCHAWTDIWDAFIPFYGRVSGIYDSVPGQDFTADSHQRWWTDHSYLPYYTNPSANWINAVKTEGFLSSGITARDTWAGVLDRYVQLYGVEAVPKTMAYIKNYAATNPAPATAEAKERLHIAAMAAGANANLSCFLDEWRWYGSTVQPDQTLRNEMALLFGPPQNNAFCKDLDGDGFTPLKGDCNDASFSVKPGATEVVNGIDDNCNGLVDDVTPVPVSVPLGPWGEVAAPAKQGSNYMLRSHTLTLDSPIVNELPTKIRFWVTGVGLVATVPYSQDATFLWTPPANMTAGTYGYRAQLMTDTKPVSDFTSITWFEYGDPCTPDLYEAETMAHYAGNAYDQGWNLHSKGYISFSHVFTGRMEQMTVRAAGQNGAGWPNMRVTVGGVQVFNGTIATSQWADYTFSFFAQAGTAEVRIEFTNDYFYEAAGQPTVDRNLLLDKVTLSSPCQIPVSINLGPVNYETNFSVSGSQNLLINQLVFNGWTPSRIVLGIGHTDALTLNGVSVSVNGGPLIALSGDWRTINIPFAGQTAINIKVYSTTPRALRTQWWAEP